MLFKFIGLGVAFIIMITGFTVYAISTNKIIKDQRKEIAMLRTQMKRLDQQLNLINKATPISIEELKARLHLSGDTK